MALLNRIFARRRETYALPPGVSPPRGKHRLWKRIGIGVAIFFVLLILFGFFAVPPIIKSVLVNKVGELLGREVSVGAVRVNPFVLTVEIDDFLIKEKDSSARFVAFDKLRIDAQVESVYRRAPVLREISLTNPYVNVVRIEGQRYNFSDIVDKFTAPPAKPEPAKAEPATFSLNNIQLTGGSVDFDDRPQKTKHQIRDMRLAIPFLSNLPYYGEIFVQPAFSAKANGTPIELKASTKPFGKARETSVDLVLTNLNLPFYLEYVPFKLQYKPVSAFLDANLDLTFAQPVGMKPSLFVSGTTALRDFKVRELSDAPLLSFKRLDVAIERVDVFATRVAIKQVKFEEFDVTAHRARDGSINLMKLASVSKGGEELKEIREETKAEQATKAADAAPDKPLPDIRVEEIVMNGARVAWIDDVPDGSFRTILKPLDVSVRNFSTAAGSLTEARLDAKTDAGETLAVEAKYGFIERTAEGTVSLARVPLKRYAPYYRKAILFDIEDGVLDASTRFSFVNDPAGPAVSAAEIETALANLRLKRRGDPEPFFRMAQFQVHGATFDLGKREIRIAEIASKKANLAVRRAKDGTINLTELTPKPEAPPPSAPPPAPAPRPAAADKPWVFGLKKLTLDDYAVRFDDETPPQPVQVAIEPIKLGVENFSFGGKPAPAKVDLALRINKTGELKAKGLVTPQPLDAEVNLSLTRLGLPPFEPYFADRINITLASGEIAAEGALKFSMPPAGKPLFEYEGSAGINKLATLDKGNAEDFLKWESLFFDSIRLKSEPLFVDVKEVALTDFYSRLVVNADGTLNVQGIMTKGDEATPAGDAAPEPPQPADPKKTNDARKKPTEPAPPGANGTAAVTKVVKIDKVTLQGGTINFSDRLIKPNVSATMTEVGGRVTGLMSDASTRADVDLRGKLSNQAPLTITGKINPLAGDLFADLKVSFIDIELPPFTPYSGKFAGYTIAKGKLTLDLTYLIDRRNLKAENKILIDQFTFGDKVESPDATKLPVQLAIALLKDREGRINLDIPVEGSLDDPKFRLGKVIWGVIVNLITKAVTAPFALIGAMVGGGGGEELSFLEFAPGSAVLDAEAQKKVDSLVKALRDRPALKLEATGHVDPEQDREALRQTVFQRKLKAQKFKDLSKKNQAPAAVDDVTIEPGPEYEKYLEAAYRVEKFPKPRNFIGMLKDLPVPEMEKLMQTNIVVSDDDLRTLAVQRAQAVKEAFLKAGDIGADRIFLVEPKSLAPEAKEKQKASRVEFVLK
jgi:hypothetical protein